MRSLNDEQIGRRAGLSRVNEAALPIAGGVAGRATDVDVALVNGHGFPRWQGGSVFGACEGGDAALRTDLDGPEPVSGPGFARGDVRHVPA